MINTMIFSMLLIALLYIGFVHYNKVDLTPKVTELAVDAMKDAFLVLDSDLNYRKANPAFFEIFPMTRGIVKGQAIDRIGTWPKELLCLKWLSNQNENTEFTLECGGMTHYFNASVSKITLIDDSIIGWVVLIRDISGTVALRNQLESIANTDGLTKVFNRRYFMERAELEFEKSRRNGRHCSIIIFDLDYFKKINDRYGHMAGDEVLRSIAMNVQKILRSYDLMARYGGEEFIILADIDEKAATQFASRIKDEIESGVYSFGNFSIKCTASFGVAAGAGDSGALERTIHNADMALYRAKNKGRNRVEAYSDNELILEIMQDIEDECKGFRLYYQPIFSSYSSRCVGAEVLMRWQSPKSGVVKPDLLMPILKELDAMPKVERWVLNTACNQCKKWTKVFNDSDFYIHVNLSSGRLIGGSLYGDVVAAVEESGIEPNNMVLDFKDIFQLLEFEKGIDLLNKLRQENIRIAADASGSESSSLAELENSFVDELKIDRAFIADIDHDLSSKSLLTGMIQKIKKQDHRVCAIGVETDLQKKFLQEQGVDRLQGYLLGEPVDAHAFEEKFITQSKYGDATPHYTCSKLKRYEV